MEPNKQLIVKTNGECLVFSIERKTEKLKRSLLIQRFKMKIKGPSSVQRLALSAFLLLIVMVELGTAAKDGDG